MNMVVRTFGRLRYVLIPFITVVVIILFSLKLVCAAAGIWLCYRFIIRLSSPRLLSSKYVCALVGCFLYMLVLQAVILCSWLLSRNFPLDATVYVTLAVLILQQLYFVFTGYSATDNTKRPYFVRSDIICTAIALLIMTAIILPPFVKTHFSQPGTVVVSLVSTGIDDGHHIEYFNDRLDFNRGILFGSDFTKSVRNIDDISSYPVGWHASNAALVMSVVPGIHTGAQSLLAYVITKLFWEFVLLILFARLTFVLYRRLSGYRPAAGTRLWLIAGVTLFEGFFLIAPFRQGFYSFVPQLIAILLLITALLQLAKARDDSKQFGSALFLALIFSMGGGLPWFLVLPSLVLSVISVVVMQTYKPGVKPSALLSTYVRQLRPGLLIYILFAIALIVQVYVMIAASTTVPFVSHLTTQGPIEVYSTPFYLFIIAGAILTLVVARKKDEPTLHAVLTLLVSLLLATATIGLVQTFKNYDYGYYYYKALNTALLVVLPLALTGFGLALERLQQQRGAVTTALCSLLLIIGTVQFIGPDPGYPNGLIGSNTHVQAGAEGIDYLKGNRVLPYVLDAEIWHSLNTQQAYSSKTLVFYYEPVQPGLSGNASLLLKTNLPHSVCSDAVNLGIATSATNTDLLHFIEKPCRDYRKMILTTHANAADLARATQQTVTPHVQIVAL